MIKNTLGIPSFHSGKIEIFDFFDSPKYISDPKIPDIESHFGSTSSYFSMVPEILLKNTFFETEVVGKHTKRDQHYPQTTSRHSKSIGEVSESHRFAQGFEIAFSLKISKYH